MIIMIENGEEATASIQDRKSVTIKLEKMLRGEPNKN